MEDTDEDLSKLPATMGCIWFCLKPPMEEEPITFFKETGSARSSVRISHGDIPVADLGEEVEPNLGSWLRSRLSPWTSYEELFISPMVDESKAPESEEYAEEITLTCVKSCDDFSESHKEEKRALMGSGDMTRTRNSVLPFNRTCIAKSGVEDESRGVDCGGPFVRGEHLSEERLVKVLRSTTKESLDSESSSSLEGYIEGEEFEHELVLGEISTIHPSSNECLEASQSQLMSKCSLSGSCAHQVSTNSTRKKPSKAKCIRRKGGRKKKKCE